MKVVVGGVVVPVCVKHRKPFSQIQPHECRLPHLPGPVRGIVDPAALVGALHKVPGVGDTLMTLWVIDLHSLLHVLLKGPVNVTFGYIGSNVSSQLSNPNDSKDDSIGVDEALAVLAGTQATKASHGKEDTTRIDEQRIE